VISAQTRRFRREKILTTEYAEYANKTGTLSTTTILHWLGKFNCRPRPGLWLFRVFRVFRGSTCFSVSVFGFRISVFGFYLCLAPIIGPVVKKFVLISVIRVKAFAMPGDLTAKYAEYANQTGNSPFSCILCISWLKMLLSPFEIQVVCA
jgi:hypothetical protein